MLSMLQDFRFSLTDFVLRRKEKEGVGTLIGSPARRTYQRNGMYSTSGLYSTYKTSDETRQLELSMKVMLFVIPVFIRFIHLRIAVS